MEGKLKAILRVSLALTMAVSLGVLMTAPAAGATSSREFPDPGVFEFTVPEEATSITVETWGSGGAGGGSTNGGFLSARCGAGGGGGAYAVTLDVEPGDELVIVVGAGGIGISGSQGGGGSPSFVGPDTDSANALVLAAGGSGGAANTAGGKPEGGLGGQREDSWPISGAIAGAPGEPGATCFTSVSGAGGAGAFGGGSGGASRTGADISADGNPGNAPGGGGGGARTSQFDGERAGGAGADGRVVITWEGPVEPVCPTISPTTAEYDLANPGDVTTTITWNDATSITSIHDGSTSLTSGTDFTVVGNTLTILNYYLAGELTAVDDTAVLTITFDICSPVIFTITAIDTTGQICPTISPTTAQYDLAHPNDVTTTITWNDATSLDSVEDAVGPLPAGFHYTVVGNTLTIMNTYLAGKLTTVGDSVVLTITFDICAPVYLTIRAIDTELPVGLTGYPVNKLAVMAPWIVLGAAIIVGGSLLALKRRRRT